MSEFRFEFVRDVPVDDRVREARRFAAELRRIIDKLVVVDVPADELAAAADAAAAFSNRLEGMPSGILYEGFAETANSGDTRAFFDHSPFIGQSNPLSPPIEVEVKREDGGRGWVEGRATFGAAYEGPPGCVHGGFIAAAFDEVLGMAQSLGGQPGMTGTLTIRYRSPTPLREELQFRADLDRVEGRKTFVRGTCHAGDRLTAEAEGIFISVDFSKFAALIEERQAKLDQ